MSRRLIITNGDSAVARLKEAAIEADFLPWQDALHEGPVPSGLLLEALSLVRAQFLAGEFDLRLGDVMRQFAARNAIARNHVQYDRVELWFEHDLYDQLQLIELLNFFDDERRTEGLLLVQARDYLGTLPRSTLRVLAERTHAVEPQQTALARRAWAAFTAATPEGIAALAAAPTPALPLLGPALTRLLQEFPAVNSGLGLTEERVLAALGQGPQTVAELFTATQAQETARFLGDASFFRLLDRLAFARRPLIGGLEFPSTRCAGGAETADYKAYGSMQVRITEDGRSAFAGGFDHAAENAIDRWFGGTHITAKTLWRRDARGLARPE